MSPKIVLMAGGLALWIGTGAAWGEKVALVLSRSADPYVAAARGFQHTTPSEVEVFNMEGDTEKGQQIMRGVAPATVLAVVTIGTEASQATRALDPSIPIVYTMVLDPLELPQHRSTGVVIKIGIEAQFARMQKLFPTKKRIGVIYNPKYSSLDIEQARKLAPQYELALTPLAVERPEEVPTALPKLVRGVVDLIWMVPDRTVAQPAAVQDLIDHALQEGLPLIGLSMYHVKIGALAAFSVDFNDVGIQTAKLAQRFLSEGGRLPVEMPRKIIIYVNPKVQKQIGIEDLSVFPEVNYIQ